VNIYGGQGYVCLLSSMGEDHTPALAARVSFADYENGLMNDRNLRLIKYLAKHQHTSPFEHQTASFVIDCPIYVARQIMRHRTFSYNEVSRRYTSEALDFHLPDELRAQAKVIYNARPLKWSTGLMSSWSSSSVIRISA
jgi:thymidylate synthase (FAD)